MEHLPKIIIQVIPIEEQRNKSVGDYYIDDKGNWVVSVAKMNAKYEYYVALHEFIELFLTQLRGVKLEDIDAFDEKTMR